MPKKHNHNHNLYKPTTSVHPSLIPSSSKHGSPHAPESSSVNELIQQLRRIPGPSTVDSKPAVDDPNMPSVHPSLKHILQVPDTPAPRSREPVRQRVRDGVRLPGVTGLAGPAAPRSWQESTAWPARKDERAYHGQLKPRSLDRLPGIRIPPADSLVDLALKSLAKDWVAQAHYHHEYLAVLPKHLKEALLAYIAVHSPETGVTLPGLKILFRSSDASEDDDDDDITHLDLAGSLNNDLPKTLTLLKLGQFFTKHPPPSSPASAAQTFTTPVPETWDSSSFPLHQLPSSTPRFPSLTHLSLSHASHASWPALLELTPHLTTLTHLSIAYWPYPTFSDPPLTAFHKAPHAPLLPAADHNPLDSPTQVLRKLAQGTRCLKWLDLAGCTDWLHLLSPRPEPGPPSHPDPPGNPAPPGAHAFVNPAGPDPERNWPFHAAFDPFSSSSASSPLSSRQTLGERGVDWVGSWGGIETVVAADVDEAWFNGEESAVLQAQLWDGERRCLVQVRSRTRLVEAVERSVRERRRAVGGKGVRFVFRPTAVVLRLRG